MTPVDFDHRQILHSAPKQSVAMERKLWKRLSGFTSLWNKWTERTLARTFPSLLEIPILLSSITKALCAFAPELQGSIYIYKTLHHCAIHLKQTQHCKWNTVQHKIKISNRKNIGETDISESLASLMAQRVNNPSAVQETQETRVWSLGREDPLQEERAIHSDILAWKIPRTEEPDRL